MNDNLQKLEKLLSIDALRKFADKALVKEDVLKIVQAFAKVVKDLKDTNMSEWRLIHQAMQKIPDKMMSEMMSSMSVTEKRMVKDCMDKCEKVCAEMDKKHKEEMAKMSLDVKMIQADRETIIEDALAKVPPQVLETSEQIIEKINSSKEQIDKERIAGLEDEIKALRKEITTKASGGVRRVFQPYVDDFSGQTNGVLKTFTLSREPSRTNTILVWGTDFPVILRPTTDFTVSGRTFTLTSAVPAPNTGATLLVHFFA